MSRYEIDKVRHKYREEEHLFRGRYKRLQHRPGGKDVYVLCDVIDDLLRALDGVREGLPLNAQRLTDNGVESAMKRISAIKE